MTAQRTYDVVVVGAGIVGLAHAYHAHERGLSVAVVDHADRVVGASVQNFGHACITAQSSVALEYARAGRAHWLDLAHRAGFWAATPGTFCVARYEDELAVMREFATLRGDAVRLLTADEFRERVPVRDPAALGGMHLRDDLQVDPRRAAPAIAQWLESVGVDFHWRTAAVGFDPGVVRTSRGVLAADTTFVTVGHDVDRLFPALADRDRLERCRLHMLRVRIPSLPVLPGPLFTGWSLVRYSGFQALPSTAALARRLREQFPTEAAVDLHQMYTPQPDGSLLVGDTHVREVTASPFQDEEGFAILLDQTRRLFGVDRIDVEQRWQGVYSTAPGSEFLIEQPFERVHVVTVTTGIGMTTSMGLGAANVARACTTSPAHPTSFRKATHP